MFVLGGSTAQSRIVVARAGRPVARLVPLAAPRAARVQGRLRGKISFADDFEGTPEWLVDAFEGTTE